VDGSFEGHGCFKAGDIKFVGFFVKNMAEGEGTLWR
jgi:hypothetical protein